MKKRIDIDTTLHTDPKFNFLSKNKKSKKKIHRSFIYNKHSY